MWSARIRNFRTLFLITITLIIGTAFIFLTPPWWHHDESGHFQTAWFFAHYGRFQVGEEYDPEMRIELAKSLDEARFYESRNYKLDLQNDQEPWVRKPAGKPRLSYLLYAIPLVFSAGLDLAEQLILLRFVSLVYFVLTVLLIDKFGKELFPKVPAVGFLAAALFALLPGAINQMTAVSKEPLGVLLFTALLFFSHRLFKEKTKFINLLAVLGFFILTMFTIDTTWIALPILLFVSLSLTYVPSKFRRVIGVILISLVILASLRFLRVDEARYFYKNGYKSGIAKTNIGGSTNPKFALGLKPIEMVTHRLPSKTADVFTDKSATIGFYIWAEKSATYSMDQILHVTYGTIQKQDLALTTEPTWVTIPVSMADEVGNIKLKFSFLTDPGQEKDQMLYISDIVFTEGTFSNGPPRFSDQRHSQGEWDGKIFINYVRNAALSENWIQFSTTFYRDFRFIPIPMDQTFLATLQDPASSGWYYKQAAESIVKTYWGKIGASNYDLIGSPIIYLIFTGIFIIMAVTSLFTNWDADLKFDKNLLIVFMIGLTVIWLQTFFRGASELDESEIVIPWSRYAITTFPVISLLIARGIINAFRHFSGYRTVVHLGTSLLATLPISLSMLSIATLVSVFWFDGRHAIEFGWLVLAGAVVLFSITLLPRVNRLVKPFLLEG